MKVISFHFFVVFLILINHGNSQTVDEPLRVTDLPIESQAPGSLVNYWLLAGSDAFGQDIKIPVIVLKGAGEGSVMGITAAIHGNELNGIPVIQQLIKEIDPQHLNGTLIGIPGLNPYGISTAQRRYIDGEDLNRNFPGKPEGNRSQQLVSVIDQKIIPHFEIHIDLHTASFGRENTYYVRADLQNDSLVTMATLLDPVLILNSKGASFGSQTDGTLRGQSTLSGAYSVTAELGNPQVFQPEIINRNKLGIRRVLSYFAMYDDPEVESSNPVFCSSSFWIYTDAGGMLEVMAQPGDQILKGQQIAVLKTIFGDEVKRYLAPEDGIVIGINSNPAAMSGDRILHLGILKD